MTTLLIVIGIWIALALVIGPVTGKFLRYCKDKSKLP